ncbi:MAG: phage virion morphogenesis protein [Aquabacterium sp.]
MAALTIKLQDDKALRQLERAAVRLRNPRELMDLVGATLEAATAQRFKDKVDPTGAPWAPVKASTLERLRASRKGKGKGKGGGSVPGTLLDRSARGMRAGLTHNLLSDREVEVGFDKHYAVFHEFGTRHMPRRGLLTADPEAGTLGKDDLQDVLDVVNDYLREVFDE